MHIHIFILKSALKTHAYESFFDKNALEFIYIYIYIYIYILVYL